MKFRKNYFLFEYEHWQVGERFREVHLGFDRQLNLKIKANIHVVELQR